MEVRAATVDDADEIARIFAAVAEEGWLATEAPIDVSVRAARFRDQIMSEGREALWVLEDEGRMVGHAALHETAARGVLSLGMAILPEARGRGGGRALLDAIIDGARSRGAHKVELEVWTDNRPAISLYTSAGFEVEGLRRDHYLRRDGTLRSALLMARLLRDR